MSKNWWVHHKHVPEPCPAGCGKRIRRIGKHLNHFHPDWYPVAVQERPSA